MNVAIITLRMSEERKGQRMDACKFGIPVQDVHNEKVKLLMLSKIIKEKTNSLSKNCHNLLQLLI